MMRHRRRRALLAAIVFTLLAGSRRSPGGSRRAGQSWAEVPAFVGACSCRNSQGLALRACSDSTFADKREALKDCLAREYRSFFRPFEAEFYSDAVTFRDPLNNLSGKDSYKANVEMLSGNSFVGNLLFSDGFIDLHGVEDVPEDETRLRTRWTLGFVFKLLPWRPKALFSGVSEYVIDPVSAIVLSQRDYWDILSLDRGGSYVPEAPLAGVIDLVGQLLPEGLKPDEAQEPAAAVESGWMLLRRARAYRVYRSPEGSIFAVAAPGFDGSLESMGTEMKAHGLTAGSRIEVQPGGIQALQLLPPHPWGASTPT